MNFDEPQCRHQLFSLRVNLLGCQEQPSIHSVESTMVMPATNSRLIIKNIPKHIDERRLREHFSVKGEITDAKVVRTKTGKSRQFAFVGFATDEDANKALKYYNSTFLDTSRIQVERAQPKGDSSIARPWSKYSAGSSRAQQLAKAKNTHLDSNTKTQAGKISDGVIEKAIEVSRTDREDVGREEFIATLRKRSQARFWDNDDALPAQAQATDRTDSANTTLQEEESTSSAILDRSEGRDNVDEDGLEDIEREDGQAAGPSSDMDWLRSKVVNNANVESSPNDDGNEVDEKNDAKRGTREKSGVESLPENKKLLAAKREQDSAPNRDGDPAHSSSETDEDMESGLSSGRLFVRNLPYTCSEEDLRDLFQEFGLLSEVHLPVDDLNKGKGFAFVQFTIPENAKNAVKELDKHAFRGRLLHIIPARKARDASGADFSSTNASDTGKTFKEKKENARKARAGDSTGWNASFVRADTVVDALADRLGVSKGDILDREGADMAVRLAVGETHLVKENKEYFEQEGIDLSALESSKTKKGGKSADERSNTIILVKNLPYSTEVAELARRFGAFGDVGRVLLPPSRSVALVEFLVAANARTAFRRLAYTRFQHVPLYLEWAPLKAFQQSFKPSSTSATLPVPGTIATGDDTKVDEDGVEAGRASEEPFTIFVKNLSFSTDEAGLRRCFEKAGLCVRSVSIPRKRGKGRSEALLSTGIGFVECSESSMVEKALKVVQGKILDGHALELKRSTKRLVKARVNTEAQAGQKRSKLIIRNVPFQATAKELRELFSNFGQLKRVRLPKKFDGGHRGFAFVDFLTPQEANNAMTSLASTHFYGRHLVGEWAEDEEGVDILRDKAARDARSVAESANRAKRFKGGEQDDFAGMD